MSEVVEALLDKCLLVINMPVTQNVINSVSGLMTCIAAIYDLEYDGWGCELQRYI